MSKPKTTVENLLATLAGAGEAELTELRQAIAEREAARDTLVAGLQREIDGLKQIEKALDIKLHGVPPKKPRAPRGQGKQRRNAAAVPSREEIDRDMSPSSAGKINWGEYAPSVKAVYDFLASVDGPKKPAIIQAATGLSLASVHNAVKHAMFRRNPNDGYMIA